MGSLANVESWNLDEFHMNHLQPNEDFRQRALREVDRICEFLQRHCFQDAEGIKVLRVVKGGSLGKGTSLKHGSDADLVLFLDIFQSYEDQEKDRKMIIEEIERRLGEWQKDPYLLDLGLLLGLLKSFRDQEKDPEEILQKIQRWLWECQEELFLSEDEMAPFRKSVMRYRVLEKGEDRGEPYVSDGLRSLWGLTQRYTDKEEQQQMIIEEIGRWFNERKANARSELTFEKSKWSNPRVLHFKLRSKKSVDFIEFDVLPAYDALGPYQRSGPDPQPYLDLIRTGKSGAFSPCFTELQRNFTLNQCGQLKSLIRLVKYWYNEVKEKPLPPKYALELLTVYAWEQGSDWIEFNTAEGFRTVLWLIENYKELCIYWTKYYDFDNEIIQRYLQEQLRKKRPVILDPADPTANFGEAKGWDRLAAKAKSYASMKCCRKRDGSLVESWDVPAQKPCWK